MSLELTKVDPKEYELDVEKGIGIEKSFLPKIVERDGYISVYENLLTKEITKDVSKEASELRKKLVKVRTGIAEIHKTEKDYYLSAGRFVDALKNKLTLPVEQMEEKLEEIEKYFEKLEAQRIQDLMTERWGKIKDYTDVEPIGLGTMDDEMFEIVSSGLKQKHHEKIEAQKEAERLRIEQEEKDKAERERIILENEALQAQIKKEREEAEARQKEIEEKAKKEREEIERLAAIERQKQADILTEQKRVSDLEAKKQAEILAKKDAEIKAIKDAEIKAENERLAKLEAEKKENEKLAKAPIKKQLNTWVDSFEISKFSSENQTAKEIEEKFNFFKVWAKSEISKL